MRQSFKSLVSQSIVLAFLAAMSVTDTLSLYPEILFIPSVLRRKTLERKKSDQYHSRRIGRLVRFVVLTISSHITSLRTMLNVNEISFPKLAKKEKRSSSKCKLLILKLPEFILVHREVLLIALYGKSL